jgi:hypothetical protein
MRLKFQPLQTCICLLIVLSCPISASAVPVPRDTVDGLAQINVEIAELRHLNSIGRLSNEDYSNRSAVSGIHCRSIAAGGLRLPCVLGFQSELKKCCNSAFNH